MTTGPGNLGHADAGRHSIGTVTTTPAFRPHLVRPIVHTGRGKPLYVFDTGGFLNVGTPELAIILLLGYFVLGPQELYKLTKSAGVCPA